MSINMNIKVLPSHEYEALITQNRILKRNAKNPLVHATMEDITEYERALFQIDRNYYLKRSEILEKWFQSKARLEEYLQEERR